MKRKLTYIGKIQVIKTFLLSQLVYIMQGIYIPDEVLEEINVLFYRFIWKKENIDKKANERVKRIILCNNKDKGGLEMINLHDFQASFLINWAKKLLLETGEAWTCIPTHFLSNVGGCHVFKSKISTGELKGSDEIKNKFW